MPALRYPDGTWQADDPDTNWGRGPSEGGKKKQVVMIHLGSTRVEAAKIVDNTVRDQRAADAASSTILDDILADKPGV